MEQDKNNRLDELFNQAKNEPAKVSFNEIKEQFISSNVGVGKAAIGSKLIQISNLKIIVMISTLSIIVTGAFFFMGNASEQPIENELNIEIINVETKIIEKEHKEVVREHLEKVNSLSANLKSIYRVKQKLALKIRETPLDTNKKKSKGFLIAEKNKALLDTSYRFPNLGYEEITANNRQKIIMFGKVKKQHRDKVIGSKGREVWYQPDPKGFALIPMGTYDNGGEKISVQAFYMKQTEVTNLEYRTFLFDLLIQGNKKEFLIAKPDQKVWVKEYPSAFNKPMQENYFSHPAYDDYPAVGMSRKGANMYCKWFTEELTKVAKGSGVNDVRIPTKYEWEWAASGGGKWNSYPWGGQFLRNSNGMYLANFKPLRLKSDTGSRWKSPYDEKKRQYNYIADGGFHTVKVTSYNPNEFGLYCMSGNVAEMVYYNEGNKLPGTKGGSWTSAGQELQIIDGKDRFKGKTTPSVNVGFRPVITYLVGIKNKQLVGAMGTKAITVTPPGTKKITDNLFFDESEVTNFMWEEYLYWLKNTKGKTSEEYTNALPDTTVWKSKLGYGEPYVVHYLHHPSYRKYPVVGISFEQAVAYCKWRTDRVKGMFDIQKQKNKKSIYPKNFEYRLPTKEEWEAVARVGFSLKIIKKLETKYKGQTRYNLKRGKEDKMGVAGKLNDNADVTAPVLSYWPNKYGLYNLIGNVAEMTAKKGVAKGGSWTHQESEVAIEKNFEYSGPTQWLGFRCIFEVKDPELMQKK